MIENVFSVRTIHICFLIWLRLADSGFASGSDVAEFQSEKIDALCDGANSTNRPGYAVGIVREGKLVFAKGYGMANLEYGAPITPQSPFYIASMSKQFTAACVALLVQRGELRLSDEVRRYIPELLADRGLTPLTIDHLIHHTGGVREWSSLVLFAGQDTRYEQRLDNSDVLRLLARQRALEFEPGSRYSYSSGNYILLTEIVERVTGESLPQFARKNIFSPLGMTNTFFDDNYAAILPGRVESYRPLGDGHYERILKHFDVYGDGGVVTTVEDLARWDANFYENKLGGSDLTALLYTQGRLNTGETLPYAFGLEIYEHNGQRVIEHGGGMLGFTVDMMRFPNDRLTVIVLANTPERWSTTLAFQIADLYLSTTNGPPQRHLTASSDVALTSSPAIFKAILGNYWRREANSYRRVMQGNGALILDWGEGTPGQRLTPISGRKFLLEDGENSPIGVSFEQLPSGVVRMTFGDPKRMGGYVADRYNPTPPTALDELQEFCGDYCSAELNATYTFSVEHGRFLFRIGDGKPRVLFPKPESNVVWNSKNMVWVGFGEIIFERNANGQVTGLTIGDQRVAAIRFSKVR